MSYVKVTARTNPGAHASGSDYKRLKSSQYDQILDTQGSTVQKLVENYDV